MRSLAAELRALLSADDRLMLVVLFGSCAQGAERGDSDVDLAVLPAGDYSPADEAELEDRVAKATGRQVDLVRLDRTEDVVLRREIAKGAPLREASPGSFARFAAEATLAWLDLEPVYLAAQGRYLRRVAVPAGRA